MNSIRQMALPFLFACGVLLVAGCGSSPSAEELSHLDAMKQEVASLQKEVTDKKTEKAGLEQQVSTKKQELAQAVQDQNETKANLENFR